MGIDFDPQASLNGNIRATNNNYRNKGFFDKAPFKTEDLEHFVKKVKSPSYLPGAETISSMSTSDLLAAVQTELIEDFRDLQKPVCDALVEQKLWWILELIPTHVRVLGEDVSVLPLFQRYWGTRKVATDRILTTGQVEEPLHCKSWPLPRRARHGCEFHIAPLYPHSFTNRRRSQSATGR